ncbi:MAG: LacI family DNA-binding transcriptional regulator [Flavobacterium sp.]|nr:LacI family DNA-binding transcriptional regulator [Flavobacterium sp.]
MGNVTIKMLAKQLNLSTAAISKALKDSHEISAATKQRVLNLANELNYTPNPYASSLRHRKSKTIAVVLPEVADSFFSLAINGIEAIAEEKGYHVLIYLTHESFLREQAILKDFQSGRVDGVLMSITAETATYQHIHALHSKNVPIVFFDRVCDEINTAVITTNDYESSYKATQHLIDAGCKKLCFLSISNSLSISNKRKQGFLKALADNQLVAQFSNEIICGNDSDSNYKLIKQMMQQKNRPNGIIASVEKLTTDVYLACKALKLKIPKDVKVVSFSNLSAATILNPSLTTITQPAFKMGKTAATALFKALEKKNVVLKNESQVIASELVVRESTKN